MTSDRYTRLLGAAAVAAGIGFALTPGYAHAETGSDSDGGSSASSDSSSKSKAGSAGSGPSVASAMRKSVVAKAKPSHRARDAAAEHADGTGSKPATEAPSDAPAEESAEAATQPTQDEKPEKARSGDVMPNMTARTGRATATAWYE